MDEGALDAADLRIRRGGASDAPELADFASRTFAETFGPFNAPENLDAHLRSAYGVPQQSRELADPTIVTLLAHVDDELVAYAQVRCAPPPPCVTHAWPVQLQRFYVDRPAHGSGVAAELMRAVQDVARSFGGRHLWLTVWENNPRAIAFYTKCGFVDVGTAVFLVGADRQTDRVLVAEIPPAEPVSGLR